MWLIHGLLQYPAFEQLWSSVFLLALVLLRVMVLDVLEMCQFYPQEV